MRIVIAILKQYKQSKKLTKIFLLMYLLNFLWITTLFLIFSMTKKVCDDFLVMPNDVNHLVIDLIFLVLSPINVILDIFLHHAPISFSYQFIFIDSLGLFTIPLTIKILCKIKKFNIKVFNYCFYTLLTIYLIYLFIFCSGFLFSFCDFHPSGTL